MKATLRSDAERVETLIPQAMRALYRQDPTDPLLDFSVAQLRLLRSLREGASTASSLGEALGLSVSAITQMANRLEASGLVVRIDDVADRRIKHLSLTERGLQLLAERRSKRIDQAEEVLARLTGEQRAQLIDSLNKVVLAGGSHEGEQPHSLVAELELRLPPAS
jgi:DNA-binding MarR family transcriptional regulator